MIIINETDQEMFFSMLVLRENLKKKALENKEPLLQTDLDNAVWSIEQKTLDGLEKLIYSQTKAS